MGCWPNPTVKTTAKHFSYFRSRCQHYQKELGLMGWDITFRHEKLNSLASCAAKGQARLCVIRLAKDWKDMSYEKPDLRELDVLAFHEMCHLLLFDLMSLTESRFVTRDEIDRTEEEIVVRLENYHRSIT